MSEPSVPEGASPEDTLAYREVARVLRAASPLNRDVCPSREDLIAEEATLGTERLARRSQHLAACPLCREDLRAFADLSGKPLPGPFAQAAAAVRATLVLAFDAAGRALEVLTTSLEPYALPELAPARGGGAVTDAQGAKLPFAGGTLELQWGAVGRALDLRSTVHGDAPRSYLLVLRGPGGVEESLTSDESGSAHLSAIQPGTYTLSARPPHDPAQAVEVSLELRAG